jgi:hypothetical protein
MTDEAVFVMPDHGAHKPAAGTTKPFPTKLVPPFPKPPFTLMQKFAAERRLARSGPGSGTDGMS